MKNIYCTIDNCSHFQEGICFSNRVDIGGGASENETGTCCDSFLNKKNYSRLTNSANSSSECHTLICNAVECANNNKNDCTCSLESITVSGPNAQIYTETNCASFIHQ